MAHELYVARGENVVSFDLVNTDPNTDKILKLMLGPTGNLRAPTIVVGNQVVVGFNLDLYDQILG